MWEKFCHQRNEVRKLKAISWVKLYLLLCAFFKDVRKKNGDEYEPGILTCLQRSIQRYLNTHGSQVKLTQSYEFKLFGEVSGQKENSLESQLSVHRNLNSLDSYKSASIQHQRRMSLVLVAQQPQASSKQLAIHRQQLRWKVLV